MADFQTHITTSTVLGLSGGLAANAFYDVPAPSCMMAAALCSVAGMMPDLDSDSDVPLRESVSFAAAVIPVMMLHRLIGLNLELEMIILICALLYLLIRFGFSGFLKNYTVHHGMFHSIPAAFIFAEFTFLIFDHNLVSYRLLNAGAVLVGYLSHLMLDEMWNVEMRHGMVHFKNSFGSALKFWGDNSWANMSGYGVLVFLTLLMTKDQGWTNTIEPWINGRYQLANSYDMLRKPQLTDRERYMKNQYGAQESNEEFRMASNTNNQDYTKLSANGHLSQPQYPSTLGTPQYRDQLPYRDQLRPELKNDRAPYNPSLIYPTENPANMYQLPSSQNQQQWNYPNNSSGSLNYSAPLNGGSLNGGYSNQLLPSYNNFTQQPASGNLNSNQLYSPYSSQNLSVERNDGFNPVNNFRSYKNKSYPQSNDTGD